MASTVHNLPLSFPEESNKALRESGVFFCGDDMAAVRERSSIFD
jgi:hypothetical protein